MGQKIGPWEIVRDLREGGQAHTFLVQREADKSQGVLKRLKNTKRSARFVKEIESHKGLIEKGVPGLPKILDIVQNESDGRPWYVMDYYPLGALDGRRAITCREPLNALRFFEDLLRIVMRVHDEGVIHRDIKPANIVTVRRTGEIRRSVGMAVARGRDRAAGCG